MTASVSTIASRTRVWSPGATTTTSSLRGLMKEDASSRAEFLALVGRGER